MIGEHERKAWRVRELRNTDFGNVKALLECMWLRSMAFNDEAELGVLLQAGLEMQTLHSPTCRSDARRWDRCVR